jgi:isocitrate lyase
MQVSRLRGTHLVEHSIANQTSRQLWQDVSTKDFVPALGCLTGQQAVQCVRAGLQAIYLSGACFK